MRASRVKSEGRETQKTKVMYLLCTSRPHTLQQPVLHCCQLSFLQNLLPNKYPGLLNPNLWLLSGFSFGRCYTTLCGIVGDLPEVHEHFSSCLYFKAVLF